MSFKKYIIIIILAASYLHTYAQSAPKKADTTAMINNFNKVMGFATQPYLYYSSITKMQATPILQAEDTMSLRGEYYKNETNLYSSSAKEDMYIEDSFYIEINHSRKSIWVSKVNVETKKKMNQMPLDRKDIQDLFRKSYTISQTEVNNNTSKLNFETVQNIDSISKIVMQIQLQYDNKKYLPQALIMDVYAKQQVAEENVQQLKDQGTDTKQLIQTEGEYIYMVRTQKMTMTFEKIDNSKEKAMQIPSWKTKLDYNAATNEFTIKDAKYSEYEITKTY
jgi:hypothetical protein